MQKAIDEKDYAKINMFERKLAQFGVDTKLTDFNAAMALAQDGKIAEAYERMQELAPVDEPGYPRAHLWIIQQLLDGKLNLPRDERLRLLKVHLDHLDKIGIKVPEIQMMRAYWLTQSNQPAEAARLLEPLVNKIPQAAVMRMEIDTSRQMLSEARRDARAVRTHMAERAGKNQALTSADYRAWTFAERLVGDDSKLQNILRQWIKIDPDNREARQVYADLCRRRFIELLGSPHADDEEILDLFLTEAEYSNNRLVLQDDATVLCRLQSELPVAKRVIDQLLTSPRTTSPVLEILGTVAALENRWDQAEVILKRSRDLDPNNPVAWNNLACVYSQRPKPDLQQALIAANKALELAPDEYRFRETRGQIMVKLKRWKEAVDDLEFAVNGIPDAPQVHSSLAAAYEALGQPQLARAHRRYAP
jgi:tetratricopeptide (TPR) repeat protein